MGKSRRRMPKGARLARKQGKRRLKPVLLIVCEGKTEKNIICKLRGLWRIATAAVEVVGQAGVPKTVVDTAEKRRKALRADEVWVVFDKDDHDSWSEAIDRAHALGFKLAVSNPCFELWGILLFQDFSRDEHRTKLQSLLGRLDKGYDHDKNPILTLSSVIDGLEAACSRAEHLIASATEFDELYRSPTTRVHHLINRLGRMAVEG